MTHKQVEGSVSSSIDAAIFEHTLSTTVVLVDDHPSIREALGASINSKIGMRVVGECATAEEAVRQVERRRPNVVVVDISLQETNGLDLVEELHARYPELRIVVFSVYDEDVYAERALQAGASAYIAKTEPPERVTEAIRAVTDT